MRLARHWTRVPSGRTLTGLLLLVAVLAGVVGGVLQLRTETGPESFLPDDDPTLGALQDSARSFGGDPVVVLIETEKPRSLLAKDQLPKLLELEGELAGLADTAVVYGPATVLNQVAGSSQQLLASLSGRRDALAAEAESAARERDASSSEVKAARERAVAKFDGRYGKLLVRGLPAGLPTLRNPRFAEQVVFDSEGNTRPQWQFVVPDASTAAILVRPREGMSQVGTEKLVDDVTDTVKEAGLDTERVTVTGVPAVTAALGSQISWEMPLLGGLAVLLIAACYFLVPWIGPKRYRLWPLAAALAATGIVLAMFGWLDHPLSLGVVAFLPILVGIASDYPAYLAHPGRRRSTIVAGLASAAAFASLAISPVPFVRDLGLALCFGLLATLGLGILVGRRLSRDQPVSEDTAAEQGGETSQRRGFGARQRAIALVAAAGISLLGWVVLPDLDVEAQPDKLASGLPAMDDIHHAEQVLGGSGEVQVVLKGDDVLSPAALKWMNRAEDRIAIEHGREVRPIVSPPGLFKFLGDSPTAAQVQAGTQLLPPYLTGSVVRDDHERATMSFLLQLQDLGDQQRVLQSLREVLPPTPDGLEVELVGLPVVAARGYDLISGSVYLTSTVGIFSAGLVLLIGLRRRGDALRAVLAAALATGWGLAVVAGLGMSLTPLTLALGSLTTATACEFLVMLSNAREKQRVLLSRTVGVAAAAASLGFLALAVSGLDMVREFGLLLAGTVLLSYGAARLVVVVLPRPLTGSPRPSDHVVHPADRSKVAS